MSFEVESLAQNNTQPQPAISNWKSELIINPYQTKQVPTKPVEVQKQDDIKLEEKPEEPKTEDTVKLPPLTATLARKEMHLRKQQQEFEKQKAAIASEKEELEKLRSFKSKLDAKDYSVLDGVLDYNEYSQYQINKANGQDPIKDEIKRLNDTINALKKQSEDSISKQFDMAVRERRDATKRLIDTSDQFPLIKKAGAHEAVVQHILDTWEQDEEELSIEQASQEVENILKERASKWAGLLEGKKEVEKTEPKPEEKKPLPPLRTLTNQNTLSGNVEPSKKAPSYANMTESERLFEARKRALERLKSKYGG